VCESQLTARLQVELETLQKDKEELQGALQAAREKVHSLEVLVTSLDQDLVTQDTHDNQASFSRLQHNIYVTFEVPAVVNSLRMLYNLLDTSI
jgi:predicted nuclease with TOPRIM domain